MDKKNFPWLFINIRYRLYYHYIFNIIYVGSILTHIYLFSKDWICENFLFSFFLSQHSSLLFHWHLDLVKQSINQINHSWSVAILIKYLLINPIIDHGAWAYSIKEPVTNQSISNDLINQSCPLPPATPD